MSFSPKASHLRIPHVPHGGPDYRGLMARGLSPQQVLDFSASVNPFPPAPELRAALASSDFQHYPDSSSLLLRQKLAQGLDLAEEEILVTAGASEALDLIALAYVRPGSVCLVLGPTYGEYARSAALHGGIIRELRSREEDSFGWDLSVLGEEIRQLRPNLVYLCSPNNPTGFRFTEKELEGLREAVRSVSAGLILDEAYLSFQSGGGERPLKDYLPGGDLIVVRSMTKDYGIPGARLGYLAAPSPLSADLERVRTPWSVSSFAQDGGLAALEAEEYYRHTWGELAILAKNLREQLQETLLASGEGRVFPGEANFVLVKLRRQGELLEYLARHRILVRDCSSFGLPDFIRIGVRTDEENSRLVDAVGSFVRGDKDG